MFTGKRKRKQHAPQPRKDRAVSYNVVDDFEQALKTPPRAVSPEVTIIDDVPEPVTVVGDRRQLRSYGTMYEQHKPPGDYRLTRNFKIPRKNAQNTTSDPYQSTNKGTTSMLPSANCISLINKASKSMNSKTLSDSPRRTTDNVSRTNEFRNSMESSLPPLKKKPFKTSSAPSTGSGESMLWDDTCLGLKDPNTSFSSTKSDSVQEIKISGKSTSKSTSPEKDDEIVSNASSGSTCVGYINVFQQSNKKKQESPKKDNVTACKDVLTIDSHSDDEEMDSELPPVLFVPPRSSPRRTKNTDNDILLNTHHPVQSHSTTTPTSHTNIFAKSHTAKTIQVTPQFLPRSLFQPPTPCKKPGDILSMLDSPSMSKEGFTYEVGQSPEETGRPSNTQKSSTATLRRGVLRPTLTRLPLRSSTQSTTGGSRSGSYSSKESGSSNMFSAYSGVSRGRSTRSNSCSTAGHILTNHRVKKPLRLKHPVQVPRLLPLITDEDEAVVLTVCRVQIGQLCTTRVLHVELRGNVLCMKLDYEGLTETVKISLGQCLAWQLHLEGDPYIICISVKVHEIKASNSSSNYLSDSDLFNPQNKDSPEQYLLLTLEEKPSAELVSSLLECLKKYNSRDVCGVDMFLSTETAYQLVGETAPSKPCRSHGRPLSTDELQKVLPAGTRGDGGVRLRRSLRSRKPPVRMDPSSPITLGGSPSPLVHNTPDERLLTYNVPAGSRVNIELSTHDVATLVSGQYLNDKVVDFYLRYMWFERLAEILRSKVHIFSSFFHTRLKDASRDKEEHKELLVPERQHSRVKTWTRRVNLFDKEYVILPVCDRAHWFVVIIYKAGQFDPDVELAIQAAKAKKNRKKSSKKKFSKKKSGVVNPVVIAGSSTEGEEPEEPLPNKVEGSQESRGSVVPGAQLESATREQAGKDGHIAIVPYTSSEDEGSTSLVDDKPAVPMETDGNIPTAPDPLEEDDTVPTDPVVDHTPQPDSETVDIVRIEVGKDCTAEETPAEGTRPCVMVLDSLGVRRLGTVKTIRNYLTVEWRERKVKDGAEELTFDRLPVVYPEIPLQNNSSDCGVFVLQYVESLLLCMEEGLSYPETAERWGSYEKTGAKRTEIEDLIMGLSRAQADQNTVKLSLES